MRTVKILLSLLLIIMTIPLVSLIVLSFGDTGGIPLRWYASVLQNHEFVEAFGLSILISLVTGVLSVLLSFIISLAWYNSKQLFVVLLLVLLLGLLPPDILALAISNLSRYLGMYSANLFFLVLSLTLYTLPIGILIIWSGYNFINSTVIKSARDLGFKRISIIVSVILPLIRLNLISVFFFSFLLAFNEYPRSYYLSGSYVMLSEYLNGKLNSGADGSIYAGGGITIFVASIPIIIFFLVVKKGRLLSRPGSLKRT